MGGVNAREHHRPDDLLDVVEVAPVVGEADGVEDFVAERLQALADSVEDEGRCAAGELESQYALDDEHVACGGGLTVLAEGVSQSKTQSCCVHHTLQCC